MEKALSAAEEAVMRHTFQATMTRAAALVDGITQGQVEEAQAVLFSQGVPLEKVARVDRAMLAAAHLRACAANGKNVQVKAADLKRYL